MTLPSLLQATLDEEKEADEKLSTIAGKVMSETAIEDTAEPIRSSRANR